MISKLIDFLTGTDDLERVASKRNLALLNAYLKKRRVWIPQRPKRLLDPAAFTSNELMELIQTESNDLAADDFEAWILEVDGKRRLPAFSSQKRMQAFSARISQDLNKVFALGYIEILLPDFLQRVEVDFVDLNSFSKNSWEIGASHFHSMQ